MGPKTVGPMNSISQSLAKNKAAFRELAMGVMFLGGSMLGLGVAMSQSNNEVLKSVGNIFMMAGSIMMAVGSSVQFIAAIGKMANALKALRLQQILTQAFAGPAGWASLAVGAAVAGGVVYGMSKYEGAQAKSAGGASTVNNVTQHIAGSVVTERQLTDSVQQGLLQKGQRNYGTGVN